MKAPDKIYIAETPNKLIEIWSEEPIESKPYITEHEYIRKDALLEWAEEEMMKAAKQSDSYGRRNAFMDVIDKLNSI